MVAGDRGEILETFSTVCFGFFAPERLGPTCRIDIRRMRLAFDASKVGSKPKLCTTCYKRSPTIWSHEAGSI